mmetsp:Transcript_24295/g.57354  ORF Transcript_24295/g.57354 Transcript_24295/m.57354 type:complete len:90 (-) Transcript_24295:709-978(-)
MKLYFSNELKTMALKRQEDTIHLCFLCIATCRVVLLLKIRARQFDMDQALRIPSIGACGIIKVPTIHFRFLGFLAAISSVFPFPPRVEN